MSLLLISITFFLLAYPIDALVAHGLNPAFWPGDAIAPHEWFGWVGSLELRRLFGAYWEMAIGGSPAFPHGGLWYFWVSALPPLFSIALSLFGKPRAQLRDESGVYGSARFATSTELEKLGYGLELGIDPATGKPVRVAVEGTLVTLAPPRKGKTWGLLIPNLAYAEPSAWAGPAVVLDTKGEVYRAVAARRRALGRRVICLDPLDLVGGEGKWNPLTTADADDVLYLQRTALALLPEATDANEASAYFRNRAVDLIVGAIVVALDGEQRSPAAVRNLLDDEDAFKAGLKALDANPAARSALTIMEADPKTRDPVRSTASQAFQWLADSRLAALTSGSDVFNLADISSGEVDLFIAVPPEYRRVLAPFLRWLLSDLFAAIRKKRPAERILVLVDETASLGRYDEILTAANELPGYGASLWSFWQDRSQMISLFGEHGASTLLNTAEVVTTFNISSVDPDETERWSRALGEFTALVAVKGTSSGTKITSTTNTPQAARLMPPSAIATMPQNELLAFISNPQHAGPPLRLRKTTAFDDPRYRRFVSAAKPVGVLGR